MQKSARRAELSLLKTPVRSEGCGWRSSEPGFDCSEHTPLQKPLRRVKQHLHNHLFPSPSPFPDFVFTLFSANTLAPILAPSTLSAGGHSQPPPSCFSTHACFSNKLHMGEIELKCGQKAGRGGLALCLLQGYLTLVQRGGISLFLVTSL